MADRCPRCALPFVETLDDAKFAPDVVLGRRCGARVMPGESLATRRCSELYIARLESELLKSAKTIKAQDELLLRARGLLVDVQSTLDAAIKHLLEEAIRG